MLLQIHERGNMKKIILILFFIVNISSIAMAEDIKEAYFAGGCFWCMEEAFEGIEGVVDVISGFAGGVKTSPVYEEVARGKTKYVEAVRIVYDADVISFDTLLNVFWKNIDPTDNGGQFADRGKHYKTVIFYQTEEEKEIANESKINLMHSGWFNRNIVTGIKPHTIFYEAEEYHQDYYKKNPRRYKIYKRGSGRSLFLERIWKNSGLENTDPIPEKIEEE